MFDYDHVSFSKLKLFCFIVSQGVLTAIDFYIPKIFLLALSFGLLVHSK